MKRDKIIEIAHSQLGISESPANSNKNPYGQWYGMDGLPWCAMFVSWVFDKAGVPLGKVNDNKGFRHCQSAYLIWKSRKELTKVPEKGDIVLFDWSGNGTSNHTGIFETWTDETKKSFMCYEGNTSVSDNRNGGSVMHRKRHVNNVLAFVKPAVLRSSNNENEIIDEFNSEIGSYGSLVNKVQKMLYDLGYKITVDGYFGPETEKVIKQFQNDNSIVADGKVTPELIGFLEMNLLKPDAPETKLTTGVYLKKGDCGEEVVKLQKALNKAGVQPKLIEDGVFLTKTYEALKAFQIKNNIKSDGVFGPQTAQFLTYLNL
jgi:peptidoglycan hydrolase-like protein with peptidoglycan-binding domain